MSPPIFAPTLRSVLHFAPLTVGLGVAIVYDLKCRRIPNWISALVLVSGVVERGIDHGLSASLAGVAVAALVIVALFRPWQMGGIGGGDVKLAGAVAAWVGFGQIVWFALATALTGGVVAAVCYAIARAPARAEIRANVTLAALHNELPKVPSHRQGHPSVPYALAIASGAIVALFAA